MNNKKTKAAMVALFATLATTGTILAASIPRGIPVGEAVHAGQITDKRPKIGPDSLTFGAYDPHGDFSDDPNSKIEHLFLP